MDSDIEQLSALIEKHKAPDEPKTFLFKEQYYRLVQDRYNVENWAICPISIEQYNAEKTGSRLNLTVVPQNNNG
jgi:hypothetical protein